MGERTWQGGKVRAWDEEVMSGLGSPKCHHIHPPKRGAKGALPPERRRLHDEKAGAEPPATGLEAPWSWAGGHRPRSLWRGTALPTLGSQTSGLGLERGNACCFRLRVCCHLFQPPELGQRVRLVRGRC